MDEVTMMATTGPRCCRRGDEKSLASTFERHPREVVVLDAAMRMIVFRRQEASIDMDDVVRVRWLHSKSNSTQPPRTTDCDAKASSSACASCDLA